MRIPHNFNLFGTPISNFNLKNRFDFLVGYMPFFRITWICFDPFSNRFRFQGFIIVAINYFATK